MCFGYQGAGPGTSPESMFQIGMRMNIAGGILGAYGQYQQGAMTRDYYDFQAGQIERQGVLEAKRARENVAGFEASQRAALAAGGISADSVSARDILEDTAKKGALDELLIRHNANVEAWNARYQGRMARAAGIAGAAGALLGTAGQVADKWAQWKRTGAAGTNSNGTLKNLKRPPDDGRLILAPPPGTGRIYTGWA